jgi:translation initiation factor IF-2
MTLDGAYSLPPPLTLEGSYRLPPPPGASPTPWWLWFSGGALAVGVGIAAALWLAARNEPDRSPRPASASRSTAAPASSAAPAGSSAPAAATHPGATEPTSAPGASDGAASAAPAAPAASATPSVPRPALIEVRFDSTPSGSVFADGQSTELCRTPCAFDIDPADGGSTEQRTFVVRRAGHVDRPVTVDLAGTQREFQVALQRAEPTAHPRDPRADGTDSSDRHTVKRPARPARKPGGRGDGPPAARAEPVEPGVPAKKPPPIDPTDTLDPFRKK